MASEAKAEVIEGEGERKEDGEVYLGFVREEDEEDEGVDWSHEDSKVGGRPVWLPSLPPPPLSSLCCPVCCLPMPLLLQLYAPLDGLERAFHRVVYVFCCPDGRCHHEDTQRGRQSRCFKVLRAQLAQKDLPLHPPPPLPSSSSSSSSFSSSAPSRGLCEVCSNKAEKRCAKCKSVWYCSREHQAADWKAGHRTQCGQEKGRKEESLRLRALQKECFQFPEYEIETEREKDLKGEESSSESDSDDDDDEEEEEGGEGEEGKDMKNAVVPSRSSAKDLEWDEVERYQRDTQDPIWKRFHKIISVAPDQILRYGSNAPIWMQRDGQMGDDGVGVCHCGSRRRFEFQVLPQLLHIFHVEEWARRTAPDSLAWTKYVLDWATLAVFSCPRSCSPAVSLSPYVEEGLWIQYLSPVKEKKEDDVVDEDDGD
jgi:pre-rRNA-processing protein TSR4